MALILLIICARRLTILRFYHQAVIVWCILILCTVAGLVLFHLAAGHGLGSRDLLLLRTHVTPSLPKLGYAIDWQASNAISNVVSLVHPCYAAAFLKPALASILLVDEAAALV